MVVLILAIYKTFVASVLFILALKSLRALTQISLVIISAPANQKRLLDKFNASPKNKNTISTL